MDTRVVRRATGELVKSRLVARDFKVTAPDAGEIFAATPSTLALRCHLAMAWSSAVQDVEPHVLGVWDVSQAFLHAETDSDVFVKLPPELDGVRIEVEGQVYILASGAWYRLGRALYGYRKSPRL